MEKWDIPDGWLDDDGPDDRKLTLEFTRLEAAMIAVAFTFLPVLRMDAAERACVIELSERFVAAIDEQIVGR